MAFASIIFIFCFFPCSLLLYSLLKKESARNFLLIILAMLFYAWGKPEYVILLLMSVLVNYWIAVFIARMQKAQKNAVIGIVICMIYNIGILWVFKYLNFTIAGINTLLHTDVKAMQLVMPAGISFFTFKAISYCLDVYYQTVEAEKNLWNVALYISYFPQIMSGPIQTYHSFLPNIRERNRSVEMIGKGIRRFLLGLGKKVLIADNLAPMVTDIFSTDSGTVSIMLAWIGAVSWLIQLFFDFSGYSDMALGVGMAFGFECEENFNYPYISKSIGEYYRRWHISLGNWFNEYLYMPIFRKLLEKKSPFAKRNVTVLEGDVVALIIVWTFTGLWHGDHITYIVWGFYYATFIIIERFIKRHKKKKRNAKKLNQNQISFCINIRKHIITMLIVIIGQVIFRSDNMHRAYQYIFSMFGGGSGKLVSSDAFYYLRTNWVYLLPGILFCFPVAPYIRTAVEKSNKVKLQELTELVVIPFCYIIMFLISVSYLLTSATQTFLYFNF